MSALAAATGSTTTTSAITWPSLQLPDTSNSGLSPATQSALSQFSQSLQSWYSQVQGAVTTQFNSLAANQAQSAAAAAPSTASSTPANGSTDSSSSSTSSSDQITTSELAPGVLSADQSGRDLMAAQYLTPDKVLQGSFTADDKGRQGFAAFFVNAAMVQPDAYNYVATVSGDGTGYTIGFTPHLSSVAAGYTDGLQVGFRAPAACDANCTLDAGLGAVAIYRLDGTALQASDIPNGSIVFLAYSTSLNNGEGGWQLLYAVPPPLPTPATVVGILPAKGSTTNLAHGLSAVPPMVRVVAVLTAAVGGLNVGQEIAIESLGGDSIGTASLTTVTTPRPLTITIDATNINIRRESTHIYLNNSGTQVDISAGCTLKAYASSI
jgi:hypothetical protein